MALKSDAVFAKIESRLKTINPAERQVEHIYKFVIKVDGKVAKTWSKFLFILFERISWPDKCKIIN